MVGGLPEGLGGAGWRGKGNKMRTTLKRMKKINGIK